MNGQVRALVGRWPGVRAVVRTAVRAAVRAVVRAVVRTAVRAVVRAVVSLRLGASGGPAPRGLRRRG
ncbi:hypothetical protein EQG64_11215 [Streptomyces sp. S6]|nr:hypothetical protein EQG64_11215 [Streptomyces sp. S6]